MVTASSRDDLVDLLLDPVVRSERRARRSLTISGIMISMIGLPAALAA